MASDLHAVLAERHARVVRFSDDEVCTVARRLLLALVYLHDELGVMHRDIKCARAGAVRKRYTRLSLINAGQPCFRF